MKSDTNPSSGSRTDTFGQTNERADMPKLLVANATMRTRLTTEIAFLSESDYLQKNFEKLNENKKKKLRVNYTPIYIYIYIYMQVMRTKM